MSLIPLILLAMITVSSKAALIQVIVERCIDKHQLSKTCTFSPGMEYGYSEDRNSSTQYNKYFMKPVEMLAKSFERIGLMRKQGHCSNSGSTRMELESIASLLHHAQITHKLSACQSICLAACASRFAFELTPKPSFFRTPCSAFDNNEGACGDFSVVSAFFANRLGVQSYVVGGIDRKGPPHIFNKVILDGKPYYHEPQELNCQFYEAPKPQ